jgi:hypothetical protein
MTDANKRSGELLHFVVKDQSEMLGFSCETQPLVTVSSYRRPKRCPFCKQENSVSKVLTVKTKREKV